MSCHQLQQAWQLWPDVDQNCLHVLMVGDIYFNVDSSKSLRGDLP